MKRIFLISIISFLFITDSFAQTGAKYMQINTIESVVSGGLGRSKMIVTKEDGSSEEVNLENLFSLGGINFGNIKDNEKTILSTLKKYTDQGWELISTIPLTVSPAQNSTGIFMTRYLLSKK